MQDTQPAAIGASGKLVSVGRGPYDDWYERVYPHLAGYGLWLKGGEPGCVDPTLFEKSDFRILFARLSTWGDTVESFTHRLLYQIARSIKGTYPDYAFLPPRSDIPLFSRDNVPWALGINSKHGPLDFDVLGISNSIVQELVNLAPMLAASGIPVSKKERMERPDVPLVILGGANSIHTSLLMVPDPPVDVIFSGESIELIREEFRIPAEGKRKRWTKARIIEELAKLDGVIIPDKLRPTAKKHAKTPGSSSYMIGAPQPLSADVIGSGILQVSEGCSGFCSFCSESYVRKPYREEPEAKMVADAREMKKFGGFSKIDLFSFNFASYRNFYPLVDDLLGIYPEIGLKSQRMDTIATDADLLPLLHALGKSKLTFGIEGISERLRTYLHKNLNLGTILRAFEMVANTPIREVKLFFILTGLEEERDFNELRELMDVMRRAMDRVGRGPRLVFSATALVRFPWTPMEWEAAPSMKDIATLAEHFVKVVESAKFEARMAAPPSEYWFSQIVARARNPKIYEAMLRAQNSTGFLYYSIVTDRFAKVFTSEIAASGLDPDACAGPAPFDDETPPWVMLGSGLKRDFLRLRAKEAREFKQSALTVDKKIAAPKGHGVYVPPKDRVRRRTEEARKQTQPLALKVKILQPMKGVPRSLAGSLLASAFMRTWDDLVPDYLGYAGSLWDKDFPIPSVTGADILTLKWTIESVAKIRARLAERDSLTKLNALLAPRLELVGEAVALPEKIDFVVRSPFKFNGSAYCDKARLKHTLRKPEPTLAVFDFAPQTLKKSPVKALSCRTLENGSEVRLTTLATFDMPDFLKNAFALPTPEEWVRADAEAVF
jgi:radical SAM superfamily enzyme YgiQ (UPF0313 family)